jgi:type VI secretion system protein ImpD
VIGRDKIGSFLGASDCETYLNNWLVDYSTANEDVSSELRAAYPLSAANVSVREVPGKPGVYGCVVHLKPHFQLDQMTSSVKLVTEIGAGFQI